MTMWSSPGGGGSGLPSGGTEGQILTYASGAGAWRDYGNMSVMAYVTEDFLHSYPVGPMYGVGAGTGAFSAIRNAAGSSAHPGAWRLATGTTTTGSSFLASSSIDNILKFGGGELTFESIINLSALSNGTDTYRAVCGITTNPWTGLFSFLTSGIWFGYTHSESSGNWRFNCTSASTTTFVDTGIAAIAGWVKLKFVLNSAGTSAQAYINDVAVGTAITTNIPAATVGHQVNWLIEKSAGTTSVNYDLDVFRLQVILGAGR